MRKIDGFGFWVLLATTCAHAQPPAPAPVQDNARSSAAVARAHAAAGMTLHVNLRCACPQRVALTVSCAVLLHVVPSP